MKGPTDGYADSVIQNAMAASAGGLDLDLAARAIQDAMEALTRQAEVLKQATYDPTKPEQVGRTFAYTAKVVDEITRLTHFAKGQPDSRPNLGNEWLRALTDEQLEMVARWIDENGREQEAEVGEQ